MLLSVDEKPILALLSDFASLYCQTKPANIRLCCVSCNCSDSKGMNTSDSNLWPEPSAPGEETPVLKKLAGIKEPWNKKAKEDANELIVSLVDKVTFYETNADAVKTLKEGEQVLSVEEYVSKRKQEANDLRAELMGVMQEEVDNAEKALEQQQEGIERLRQQIVDDRENAKIALHEEIEEERRVLLETLEAQRAELAKQVELTKEELSRYVKEMQTLEIQLTEKQQAFKEVKGELNMTYTAYHAYFNPVGTVDMLARELRASKRDVAEVLAAGDALMIVGDTKYSNEELHEYGALLLGSYNQEIENIQLSPESDDIISVQLRVNEAKVKADKLGNVFGLEISDVYHNLQAINVEANFAYQRKLENDILDQKVTDDVLAEQAALAKKVEVSIIKIDEEQEILGRQLVTLEAEDRLRAEQGEDIDESAESPIARLNERLQALSYQKSKILDTAQDLNAGYIYVVSNPGSLNGLKIGMTRSPNPQEQIANLDNDAVPFGYVINTLFYADNAAIVNKALHERFADKAINKINPRKQFFDVELSEVKDAINEIHGPVNFLETPEQRDVILSNKSPK